MENFSSNIKMLRASLGFNQSEISDLLGFKVSTWSNYETGRSVPNISDLIRISKYFGIDESDLLHKRLDNAHLKYKIVKPEKHQESTPKRTPNRTPNLAEEPSEEYVVTNQESILRKKVEQVNELIERLNKVGSSLSKTAQEAANINVYINMVVDLKVQLKEKERLVNDLEAQLKACRQSRHKQPV